MIGEVSGLNAMPALAVSGYSGGRIVVPVRPAVAIVTNFKHIQLVPDFSLKSGVPAYKLSILDKMIELATRRSGPREASAKPAGASSIDTLIEGLAKDIRARTTLSFSGGTLPDTGLVVDLVA